MLADTAWSIACQARANNTCARCGMPSQVTHHYIHKGNHPKARHDIKNGVPVCNDCHTWIHANPEKADTMIRIVMLDRGDFQSDEEIDAWVQEVNK